MTDDRNVGDSATKCCGMADGGGGNFRGEKRSNATQATETAERPRWGSGLVP